MRHTRLYAYGMWPGPVENACKQPTETPRTCSNLEQSVLYTIFSTFEQTGLSRPKFENEGGGGGIGVGFCFVQAPLREHRAAHEKKKDRCNHGSESHAAATKKEIVSSFAEGESLFRLVYSNIHESFTPPPQNVFALSLVMGLRLAACTPCLREAAKPRLC